jgi:hypothetical protein
MKESFGYHQDTRSPNLVKRQIEGSSLSRRVFLKLGGAAMGVLTPGVGIAVEKQKGREIEQKYTEFAESTWRGMEVLANTPTGLPVDRMILAGNPNSLKSGKELLTKKWERSGFEVSAKNTSVTNVGLYLVSLSGARDLGFISDQEATGRAKRVLNCLNEVEGHQGLFPQWINTETGKRDGEDDEVIYKYSSVDNVNLSASLRVTASAFPDLRDKANRLREDMNLLALYDKESDCFYGSYNSKSGTFSSFVYRNGFSETRTLGYDGATRGMPRAHFDKCLGYYPNSEIESWRRADILNEEGVQSPHDPNRRITVSHGGGMFEALMPALFVREYQESPEWKGFIDNFIQKQIEYGRLNTKGYWGFSPCAPPNGHYAPEVGVQSLAMIKFRNPDVKVVTPHAVFLAAPFVPESAMENLQRLKRDFPGLYNNEYGFLDSVNVETREVCREILSLDHGLSYAALYNLLKGNKLHELYGYLYNIDSLYNPPEKAVAEIKTSNN